MKDNKPQSDFGSQYPFIYQAVCAPVFGVFFEAMSFPFLKIWIEQQRSASSFYGATKHILKNDRIYTQFTTVAKGTAPAGFAYFYGKKIAEDTVGNSFVGCFIQALTAQFFASLILEPMMLVLQQDCASSARQRSFLSSIGGVLKTNGVRGIYRAAVPGFLVGVTLDSLGYWFYNNIKKNYSNEHKEKTLASVAAYMLAFSIAAVFVMPFEVIATRLRFSASTEATLQESFSEKTCHDVAKKIFKTSGIRGFWHATPANTLRASTVILMMPAAEMMGHLTLEA